MPSNLKSDKGTLINAMSLWTFLFNRDKNIFFYNFYNQFSTMRARYSDPWIPRAALCHPADSPLMSSAVVWHASNPFVRYQYVTAHSLSQIWSQGGGKKCEVLK